jgi:hypothetical protein
MMCGTGMLGLLMDWFVAIQSGAVVRDIIDLDPFVPEQLQRLSQKYPLDLQNTTTIYHFGYSVIEKRFRGFVYRSTTNFASQELEYQIRFKPAVDMSEITSLPADFIRVMSQQQQQDKQLPISNQVGIGGEIHFAILQHNSVHISCCHRFDTYEPDFATMLAHTEKNSVSHLS